MNHVWRVGVGRDLSRIYPETPRGGSKHTHWTKPKHQPVNKGAQKRARRAARQHR